MALTFISANALKPRGRDYMVADGGGLYLRVWPSGKKVWLWRKKVNGKFQSRILGTFPELSIQAARKQCSIEQQPAADAALVPSATTMTFKEVYALWFASKQNEIRDWRRIDQRFNKYLPLLYDRVYAEISPMEIFSMLQVPVKAGYLETAQRLASWIAQMERYAQTLGVIEILRLQSLARTLPKSKKTHRASFPPQELPMRMPDIMKMGLNSPLAWDMIRVGFFTLLRPGEYAAMRWEWIDLENDVITVPPEAMKMKREHRVPISRQLKSVLLNIRHSNEFVFPGRGKAHDHVDFNALPRLFRRSGFQGILVPHGIRAIGRTWMAEQGLDHSASELCLAHTLGTQVEQAYNRTDLLDKRREIMQAWCDFVQSCIDGVPAAA